MTILLGVGLLLVLIALGLPIGFALGIAGTICLLVIAPAPVVPGLMESVVHHTTANFVLLTIPMFVLMSELLSAGGVARDLMLACGRLLRRVRGGLAVTAVLAGAVLAAASGSSTAAVAAIARSTFPTMKALGYKPGFAVGTISVAGTLAIMIPPSIAFVVYGIISEESIGKLFIAGILPGLLTALGYIVTISLCVWRRPELAPAPKARPASLGAAAAPEERGRVWPVMILIVLVLGALYSGTATPSEVGAIGAIGALLITVVMGRLDRRAFGEAIGHTLRTTTMIVTIIFGAVLFGYFMAFTQMTGAILDWIAASNLSPHAVLALILVFYVLLGMFMDQFAIIVLTVPITHAIATGLGFDGIWFGVLIVKTAEIGLITPPVGLNIFIASASTGVPTRQGFSGVLPFVLTELILLVVLVAFPSITLTLPSLMR
ncbi:TRAP transporter, DctM subunit [Tistlia consotensis]|uniref:TRAP transporter large permease protein n=1 Tax=Tistlia consotensis USBA 355 TaxID=560819 RepID=A0A1Y6CH18_9PROT|nr:TRAP transporter large permease subunit [Tistlia consotensis]SMF55479.1 TRAP transporter, DctM subunit [Tistlia consotensis USBA 355]SNR88523.1 TRAP transporter, DctM subunit [Tistlia consotensis]